MQYYITLSEAAFQRSSELACLAIQGGNNEWDGIPRNPRHNSLLKYQTLITTSYLYAIL